MTYGNPERRGALSAHDWRILGHEIDETRPAVARRRLDLPIPFDKAGLHNLAHRLGGLSTQLHELGNSPESARLVLGDAIRLIDATRRNFLALGRDWDGEYAGLIAPEPAPAPNIEPFRNRARTQE